MTDRKERTEEVRTFEFRAADSGDGQTLEGYAAVYDTWTDIRDAVGTFKERIRPNAFKRSLGQKTPVMQFDHGQHPLIGSIPIGTYSVAREDKNGMFVRGRLSDNWLVEPVRDAIRDGAISGMSIRMRVLKDEWNDDETVRDIIEGEVVEAGPVVWPAYTTTSVAVRSLVGALDGETRAELAHELLDDIEDLDGDETPEVAECRCVGCPGALRDDTVRCESCDHDAPHTGGGIGVCLSAGCGCDGPVVVERDQSEDDQSTTSVAEVPAVDDGPDEPPVASHATPRQRVADALEAFRRRTPTQ
jgi:HK97 family phage prohead protease